MNYPWFGMPYWNRYNRYNYPYVGKNLKNTDNININDTKELHINSEAKDRKSLDDVDTPLFRLFGLDLYFDDVLLICLILFLYDEGVKDETLFIVLIMLLLS